MKPLFFLFLFLLSFISHGQENATIKELLTRSEVSIYKVQKEMISGKIVKQPLNLSQAISMQALSVEFFNKNETKLAVWYSLKSREYSVELLNSIDLIGINYYKLNEDEVLLSQEFGFNSSDSQLQSSILSKSIDESILFDSQKLRQAYNLSIN